MCVQLAATVLLLPSSMLTPCPCSRVDLRRSIVLLADGEEEGELAAGPLAPSRLSAASIRSSSFGKKEGRRRLVLSAFSSCSARFFWPDNRSKSYFDCTVMTVHSSGGAGS